jgi:hypothetical protein
MPKCGRSTPLCLLPCTGICTSAETPPPESNETPAPAEGEEGPKPKGKVPHGAKRFKQLLKDRYDANQRADTAESENAHLKERLRLIESGQKSAEPARLAVPEGKPLRASYSSDEDWVEAISEWKAKQILARAKQQEMEQERQSRDQSIHASYVESADQYTESHPDFNQVVLGIRIAEDVAPGVEAAIVGRPNGPEVAYYLGQHPEICQELSQMNAADAVAEIGAISYSLARPAKPASRVTAQPAPIRPMSGGSTRVARDITGPDVSYREHKQYMKDTYGR